MADVVSRKLSVSLTALAFTVLTTSACQPKVVPQASVESPISETHITDLSDVNASGEIVCQARFTNVASLAGIQQTVYCGGLEKKHILESTGSGCAWIDYDEDGFSDVFVLNGWKLDDAKGTIDEKGPQKLYRNMGDGQFVDVTDAAGLSSIQWSCGVCAGDFNNDGHVDLYVTGFGGNRLYKHNGMAGFEDVAIPTGVASSGWSTGAAFFDADGDGWLDLYVAKYIDCHWEDVVHAERTSDWKGKKVMAGPFGMRGGRDQFFRNNRDGTFSDLTVEAGLEDIAESYGLGVLTSDFDRDGDVDIYVANDSNPNFLYRNDGHGVFKEIGGWNGAGLSGDGRPQGSMGVDAADLDGNGLQDLLVTNFAQDYCTIYKNDGDLFFSDVSPAFKMSEFTHANLSWGCKFFDYDCDSLQDALILNGHIYPQVDTLPSTGEAYRQKPTLLHQADGAFTDVAAPPGDGLSEAASMRGLAVADYDLDGSLDLLITAIDSPPLLMRNECHPIGHWAMIRVLNTFGSPALNATVKLTTANGVQTQEVRSGSCYCSQNGFDLHFGLGASDRIDAVEVEFLDGRTVQIQMLDCDQLHVILEK